MLAGNLLANTVSSPNPLSFLTVGSALTIFGLLAYYFGKMTLVTNPFKENKTQAYLNGFIFIISFILPPVALVWNAPNIQSLGASRILAKLLLLSQIGLAMFLAFGWQELQGFYSNQKEKCPSLLKAMKSLFYNKSRSIGPIAGILINLLTIIMSMKIYLSDISLAFKIFSTIASFFILSLVAIMVFAKEVRVGDVIFKNEKNPLKGVSIHKIEKDQVITSKKNKMHIVNRDEIKYITHNIEEN